MDGPLPLWAGSAMQQGVSHVVGRRRIKRAANAVHANGSHGLTTGGHILLSVDAFLLLDN